MTQFLATPLVMTKEFFGRTLGYGDVGTSRDYEERKVVAVDENSVEDVLDHTWDLFQNVGPGHMAPDGGRSLMVGDLIKVERLDGPVDERITLYRVDSCGFSPVYALKSLLPNAVAAARGEMDDMSYAEIASEQADVDNCD